MQHFAPSVSYVLTFSCILLSSFVRDWFRVQIVGIHRSTVYLRSWKLRPIWRLGKWQGLFHHRAESKTPKTVILASPLFHVNLECMQQKLNDVLDVCDFATQNSLCTGRCRMPKDPKETLYTVGKTLVSTCSSVRLSFFFEADICDICDFKGFKRTFSHPVNARRHPRNGTHVGLFGAICRGPCKIWKDHDRGRRLLLSRFWKRLLRFRFRWKDGADVQMGSDAGIAADWAWAGAFDRWGSYKHIRLRTLDSRFHDNWCQLNVCWNLLACLASCAPNLAGRWPQAQNLVVIPYKPERPV